MPNMLVAVGLVAIADIAVGFVVVVVAAAVVVVDWSVAATDS